MKIKNVLSLFDGCSGGQQALERAGIKYSKYYASEIDKYAIQVTQHNYPNTIQLGSVTEVDVTKLDPIDLLIGGSPCQNFSFAGKRNGMTTTCNEEIYTLDRYLELKLDGFQFEGESYLFWEYMRILTDIRKYNPDVLFLLENVEMGNKWERVLSEAIGIYGVHINSALVSAQNRKRIFWTNIRVREEGLFGELHSDIPQPEDRGILLKDILEDNVDEKYYLSDRMLNYFNKRAANFNNGKVNIRNENDKATTITASCKSVDISDNFVFGTNLEPKINQRKSSCLTAGGNSGGMHSDMDIICVDTNGREDSEKSGTLTARYYKGACSYGSDPFIKENICVAMRGRGDNNKQQLEPQKSGKTNALTSVQKDNLVMQLNMTEHFEPCKDKDQSGLILAGNMRGGKWEKTLESSRRVYDPKGKAPTVSTMQGGNRHPKTITNARIRRLTPVECERLQTVNDNYTACVSDSQRYKMLGNGWTVEIIAHIFKFIKKQDETGIKKTSKEKY